MSSSTHTAPTLSSAAAFAASTVISTVSKTRVARAASSTSDSNKVADQGIGIATFLSALAFSVALFAVQSSVFLLLRNKLARIFKPKTYLVPERERTDPPPRGVITLFKTVMSYSDRELIKKCGLDAYFFLRYLKSLLVVFVPICLLVIPILVPINYVGGKGHNINPSDDEVKASANDTSSVIGLDTLAWRNVRPDQTSRYTAHLIMALLVIVWFCAVTFIELRVYVKVRQDYLTSAEHRLRASATTVLVNSIPPKWLSVEALEGLFDVFPGGVRNVWLNRDLSSLLDKISDRDKIHQQLENAETDLIKQAKEGQLKQKKAEEKKRRKKFKLKALTKQERAEQDADRNVEAERMANADEGTNAGDRRNTPHSPLDGYREAEDEANDHARNSSGGLKIPLVGNVLSGMGHGIKNIVDKADNSLDNTLETTNGFVGLGASQDPSNQRTPDQRKKDIESAIAEDATPITPNTTDRPLSGESTRPIQPTAPAEGPVNEPGVKGNTVRKLNNDDELINQETVKIWQFWKPPEGAYNSPVPQGDVAEEYMRKEAENPTTRWQAIKSSLPFMGPDPEPIDFPSYVNEGYDEAELGAAEWEKYLKKKHRPTHHLPLFGMSFLFGVPLITKKVDTIHWCREELARLNMEIEEEQKTPERFPLMTSAFIQFNHQVGAHMACQSIVHHIPKQMAPRVVEIDPHDVDWSNMNVTWWQEWLKTGIVFAVVIGMIVLWAIPVAWTAALGQLDQLVKDTPWLRWLDANKTTRGIVKVISGVLPAAVLAILLLLIPLILDLFGRFKGLKTGSQRSEFVQTFYFVFLFIQVFLVVSIASFFSASIPTLTKNLSRLSDPANVLDLLANNLPSAANYFFSYMILQAMSVSSGTLLQIGTLFVWYILARMLDSTARAKWKRNTNLNSVNWGKFFPVYTNFACIGLVYCIISPIISIFAVITFSLLYMAQRYTMLYVTRFQSDTGGVLYPRAINQTFTGLYFMELCLAGLFFITQNEKDEHTCTPHGVIMIVAIVFTILFQVALNWSFGPLFRYLPISFEDEAVLRDEAFQRAQDRRFGVIPEEDEDEDEEAGERPEKLNQTGGDEDDIELQKIPSQHGHRIRNPMRQVGSWARGSGRQMGTWAKGGGNQFGEWAKGGGKQLRRLDPRSEEAVEYRKQQRQKDLESQRAIGDALYGGLNDEIEDLTPEERDALVRHAFQHAALRARRPVVWIPRDDMGVSDDEVARTKAFSEYIWISNEGTALDSKNRVVYGKSAPDFSEVDVIKL